MGYLRKRLFNRSNWKKIFLQRLTEPVHLNALAFVIYIFGNFRQKVAFDLIIRPQYAYGILKAAEQAKELGLKGISIVEFGVANGAGLMNMIKISEKVTRLTGIQISIYGFDTGMGMPKPVDFRDHPEYYNTGDFPMNKDALLQNINGKASLILGPIDKTLPEFISDFNPDQPLGFVSVDVDYYSSTREVLNLFKAESNIFLPRVNVYFDDIFMPNHNSKCGELLAIKEFNSNQAQRQIEYHSFFVNRRIFKKANWVKQLYFCHVLDHPHRARLKRERQPNVLDNPYLDFEGNEQRFH